MLWNMSLLYDSAVTNVGRASPWLGGNLFPCFSGTLWDITNRAKSSVYHLNKQPRLLAIVQRNKEPIDHCYHMAAIVTSTVHFWKAKLHLRDIRLFIGWWQISIGRQWKSRPFDGYRLTVVFKLSLDCLDVVLNVIQSTHLQEIQRRHEGSPAGSVVNAPD